LSYKERLNKTIVFITHDIDEAVKSGQRIEVSKWGAAGTVGTPVNCDNPADDYVAQFMEIANKDRDATQNTKYRYTNRFSVAYRYLKFIYIGDI
jgi:ABC-type proline/glycine betaine transport system ATPase subunit